MAQLVRASDWSSEDPGSNQRGGREERDGRGKGGRKGGKEGKGECKKI